MTVTLSTDELIRENEAMREQIRLLNRVGVDQVRVFDVDQERQRLESLIRRAIADGKWDYPNPF